MNIRRFTLLLLIVLSMPLCVRGQPGGGSDELFPVVYRGKWGYMNKKGRIVIRPRFDGAYPFYDGVARVMIGRRIPGGEWSYIDKTGRSISKGLPLSRLEDFSEGLGAACLRTQDEVGYLCGYLDPAGRWAIEPELYSIMSFHDGLARVSVKDPSQKTGVRQVYIDKTGGIAIELSRIPTGSSEKFSEGMARFAADAGKGRLPQGFMDKTGKVVIEPRFEAAGDFSDGLAAVLFFKPAKNPTETHDEDFDAGFIDTSGKMIIRPQFEDFRSFSEGLAFVLIGGKWGAIDRTGRVVIRPQFDLPRDDAATPYWQVLDYYANPRWSFSEGLAAVHQAGKWGYVDKTGKFVIPPRFSHAHGFSRGVALVMVGNRVGYINRAGGYIRRPSR